MNAQPETGTGQPLQHGFQLEALTVHPAEGEVAGPGGREKLDPKVMDVLVYMARHAGHVVSRDELLAALWPHAVVTDDALTRCFYELRRQLPLAGGSDHYKTIIETLPKRGYRLNARVAPLEAPAVPAAPDARAAALKRRMALGIAATVAFAIVVLAIARLGGWPASSRPSSAPGPVSIAVLPFEDLSEAQDQQYFSDGIAEEIRNRLQRTPQLRVTARGSSSVFRGKAASIPEVAAKLSVTHVLEGSVRRSGSNVRVTAQLADAANNVQIWSNTYERELGDIFAIQDEIAASVATALSITLGDVPPRGPVPAEPKAYELFLRGEFFYNRRAPGDVERAAKYYQDALAIDPGLARAWAALAGVYSLLAYEGALMRDEGLAKQGEAARKSIELDPNLAEGHARLSQYYWDMGDRVTSRRIFERAKALDPNDAVVLIFASGIAMRNGETQQAIEQYRRLVERDPLYASYHANLGVYLLAVDRFDEALAELHTALDLNPNLGWGVDLAIVQVLILQKRYDEAATAIAELPEGDVRDRGLALMQAAPGRRAEADAALARLEAQSTRTPDVRLAEIYAYRGMKEEAFAALAGIRIAIERDEPALASQLWSWQLELRVSPFLKSLRGDPRWTALLVEPT